jgi:hypothetical protein
MNNKKVWVLLATAFQLAASAAWAAQTKAPSKTAPAKAAAPAAQSATAEKPKQHQATGTVVSFTDTSLVISKAVRKKKSDWTFVLNAKTKTQGILAKGAKVTVYYHEENAQKIARRVKVWEAKPAPAAARNPKAPKPKS